MVPKACCQIRKSSPSTAPSLLKSACKSRGQRRRADQFSGHRDLDITPFTEDELERDGERGDVAFDFIRREKRGNIHWRRIFGIGHRKVEGTGVVAKQHGVYVLVVESVGVGDANIFADGTGRWRRRWGRKRYSRWRRGRPHRACLDLPGRATSRSSLVLAIPDRRRRRFPGWPSDPPPASGSQSPVVAATAFVESTASDVGTIGSSTSMVIVPL